MSRLGSLMRSPRRTLATLTTVLAAVGVTYASGADFTASSANAANTFSSGTLTMANSKSGSAVLTASQLRPGAGSEGTVDIANTGSLSGAFTLTRGTVNDSDSANPMSGRLNVVIDDCGTFTGSTAPACGDADDTNVFTGTVASMGTSPFALGTWNGGAQHRYRFRVTLDQSADNNYQGDSSTVAFNWAAA